MNLLFNFLWNPNYLILCEPEEIVGNYFDTWKVSILLHTFCSRILQRGIGDPLTRSQWMRSAGASFTTMGFLNKCGPWTHVAWLQMSTYNLVCSERQYDWLTKMELHYSYLSFNFATWWIMTFIKWQWIIWEKGE